MHCIDPEWFEGVPFYKWVGRSRECRPGEKNSPRDRGKTLNFAKNYLSSARSIADLNHVPLKVAEEWDKRHTETYKGYYAWAAEEGKIATCRGYAINAVGRLRWTDEANAKGAGESPERNAVNHLVQSYAADMTKEADLACREEFRGTDVFCLLAVHDALVFEIPGQLTFDQESSKFKNGVCTNLKFKANKEAEEITNRIIKIMEQIETEMFKAVNSPVPGKAEAGICLFWNH